MVDGNNVESRPNINEIFQESWIWCRNNNDISIHERKVFFKKAIKSSGHPIKVNIDKSGSNISALNSINKPLSEEDQIEIRQNKYFNNRIEGDRRFIKKRTRPMLGFKCFRSAAKTIAGIELLHMIKKDSLLTTTITILTLINFFHLLLNLKIYYYSFLDATEPYLVLPPLTWLCHCYYCKHCYVNLLERYIILKI